MNTYALVVLAELEHQSILIFLMFIMNGLYLLNPHIKITIPAMSADISTISNVLFDKNSWVISSTMAINKTKIAPIGI